MELIAWVIKTVSTILYVPIGIAIELIQLIFWGVFKLVFAVAFAAAILWGVRTFQPAVSAWMASIDWLAVHDVLINAWCAFLGVEGPYKY